MTNQEAITILTETFGGSLWEKGDMQRVYFNNWEKAAGLEVTRYKTGNISIATLDGEKISNSKAYKMLDGKLFYDAKADKFMVQGFGNADAAKIAAKAMRAAIS